MRVDIGLMVRRFDGLLVGLVEVVNLVGEVLYALLCLIWFKILRCPSGGLKG